MCVTTKFTSNFQSFYRPTFKTATPTSRTQLKQQLQREQLQELERQDLERREAEKKLKNQSNQTSNVLKVPLQSIGVDVPPQVLQVSKGLEIKSL